MLVHSVDPDGCRGIEVERLPAGEVDICIFHYSGGDDDALPAMDLRNPDSTRASAFPDARHLMA